MSAYCATCRKSAELTRGHADTYGAAPGAVEVKGMLACGHAATFISSARQAEEAGL